MARDLKENLKFACGSGHSMGCGLRIIVKWWTESYLQSCGKLPNDTHSELRYLVDVSGMCVCAHTRECACAHFVYYHMAWFNGSTVCSFLHSSEKSCKRKHKICVKFKLFPNTAITLE